MSNQKDQMKWVLFWVFLTLFVIMVLGTLAMVFFGFGSPTESERELMVKGLIGEVAACIVALFYSIFGLKGQSVESIKIQELEDKNIQILAAIESINLARDNLKEDNIVAASSVDSDVFPQASKNRETFENKVSPLGEAHPFPIHEYQLTPLPIDIKNEIRKAKPIDVEHRRSSYTGMKVQWKALLSTIEETDDQTLRVTADVSESLLYVAFEIKKNTNNKLISSDVGEPFWICGEIVNADTLKIEIKDVQIQFSNET